LLSGVVLIVIVWALVRLTLPKALFERARRRLQTEDSDTGPATGGALPCPHDGPKPVSWTHDNVTYRFCSRACRTGFARHIAGRGSVVEQLHTLGGWNRVAERYFKTIARIRTSVIFGFLVAGFIVALVPPSVFSTVFLPSDSFLGVLENAAVGVLAPPPWKANTSSKTSSWWPQPWSSPLAASAVATSSGKNPHPPHP